MGVIKDATKAFDGTGQAKKELDNLLDHMTALATAKADYFQLVLRQELNDTGAGYDRQIPVEYIIDFTRQTHAYSSSSADAIAGTITDAIKRFVSGGQENVMNGVGGLMSKKVKTLFASTDDGEDETQFMTVFAEGKSLVRLDLKAWKRFTNVESLSKSAEQISAFVMCKSRIKAETLDYNTFMLLYQKNLYDKSAGFTPAQIAEQLKLIKDVFDQYRTYQANKSLAANTSEDRFPAPSEAELAETKGAFINVEQKIR